MNGACAGIEQDAMSVSSDSSSHELLEFSEGKSVKVVYVHCKLLNKNKKVSYILHHTMSMFF